MPDYLKKIKSFPQAQINFIYCNILKWFYINNLYKHHFLSKSVENVYCKFFNPLLPSVLNIGRLTKILISIKEGIIRKISYDRPAYESVDD